MSYTIKEYYILKIMSIAPGYRYVQILDIIIILIYNYVNEI